MFIATTCTFDSVSHSSHGLESYCPFPFDLALDATTAHAPTVSTTLILRPTGNAGFVLERTYDFDPWALQTEYSSLDCPNQSNNASYKCDCQGHRYNVHVWTIGQARRLHRETMPRTNS